MDAHPSCGPMSGFDDQCCRIVRGHEHLPCEFFSDTR
jgi:hypothetical protein